MGVTKRYTIAYKGLKPGLHDFRFEVDGSLFEEFESPEIKDGACEVTVALERGEAMLTLDVTVDGSVVVECDRCLEECRIPVHYQGRLLVKFSDEVHEYDGEVMWLLPMEDEIDLKQYIYESIVLSLPYQRVHPEVEVQSGDARTLPHRIRLGTRGRRGAGRSAGARRRRMGQAGRAQGADGGPRAAGRGPNAGKIAPAAIRRIDNTLNL